MKKSLYIILSAVVLITGCSTNGGPEYDGKNYAQIKKFDTGVVTKSRPVVITDSGAGKFLGAIIGVVLGSTMGSGNGKTLTMLGGGLAGGYAGSEIAKANAQELTVALDNGEDVVVVIKGNKIESGDRVKIIKDGNRVAQVDRID
ncbi:MAG: glycine zipper 2TM domain-containing protein [Sulfurimonas sp.]